jgi:hypothetical protein
LKSQPPAPLGAQVPAGILQSLVDSPEKRLPVARKGAGERAKISATVSMLLCAILMLVMLDHGWPVYLAIVGMSLGNLWIWSRPERLPAPA